MSGGNDKLERELESFLADDSRVAALYRRLPKDEPDAKLDAAILAQARAAIAPRRTRPRWLPALSAAAAIVVVAGLAYRVGPQVWNERSAVSEKAEQRVAAPASVPQQQPPADASASANAPLPQAETSTTSSSTLQTETVSRNAIQKKDAERARRTEADKLQSQKRKTEEEKTAASAFAKQSVQGQVQAELAHDNANAPPVAQPEAELKPASPPRLDAVPAPAEPAPARLAAPKPVQPNAFPTAAGAPPASPSPPPPAAARAPVRESAQSAADIEVNLYPEHWIADIQQMLKDGRRDDAIRNLKEFRKRYPEYTLPDTLRDLK